MHDTLLSDDQLGYILLCSVVPYLVMSFFLLLLLTRFGLTGETIGATFLWFLMLSIAGLLGYELSVRACPMQEDDALKVNNRYACVCF